MKEINLSSRTEEIFSTRPRGELFREEYKIDEAIKEDGQVEILLPANLKTITSSFFLGMFGEIVKQSSNKEEFLKQVHFKNANDTVQEDIEDGIRRALRRRKSTLGGL